MDLANSTFTSARCDLGFPYVAILPIDDTSALAEDTY